VTNHVYYKHLSNEEYPFYCSLCSFSAVPQAKCDKHGKWYLGHKLKLESGLEPPMDSYMRKMDNGHILAEMMVSISIEESRLHLELRKRPPIPVVTTVSAPAPVSVIPVVADSLLTSNPAAAPDSATLPELLTEEDQAS
jgi:hypothetical protein